MRCRVLLPVVFGFEFRFVLLQLGQVQQQVQQSGPFLELAYVWLPAARLHVPGQSPAAAAQSKACISAQAVAGYAVAKQRDHASRADPIHPDQRAAAPSGPAILPGSPTHRHLHRSAVVTSSSSSAQVVSEAFSNLQPAASVSLRTAAGSTGHKSAAGEIQAPAHGCDVNSSVSGLVTPGKAQPGSLQEASIGKPEDTPGSSHLAPPAAHQGLDWDSGHVDFEFEPRLSQSHPDIVAAQNQPQEPSNASQQSKGDTEFLHTGTRPRLCPSHPCQALPEPNPESDCSQSLEEIPDAVHDSLCQASEPRSGELTEQPSGFLSGEPSVWSIQPSGALSAEPSGCWDDLPEVALSLDDCLPAGVEGQHQRHEHHTTEPSRNMGLEPPPAQTHAEPDPFGIDELDFDLPLLDSPDQPATLATSAGREQLQQHAVLEPLHSARSGDAQQAHEPGAQAVAQLGDAIGQRISASVCGASSLAEAHQACGSGSMLALLSSEAVSNRSWILFHILHSTKTHKWQK